MGVQWGPWRKTDPLVFEWRMRKLELSPRRLIWPAELAERFGLDQSMSVSSHGRRVAPTRVATRAFIYHLLLWDRECERELRFQRL